MTQRFCSQCGGRTAFRTPEGDHLPRHVCDACGIVHYENPRVVVGCVPEHDGRILICRRAIEPRRGYWTIPAGFLENGESLEDGAARESHEEALARVRIDSLLAVVSIVGAHQVHVFFRATLSEPDFGPGPESLEVKLVTPDEIPWDEIAFTSTRYALERYLEDRVTGATTAHVTTFAPRS